MVNSFPVINFLPYTYSQSHFINSKSYYLTIRKLEVLLLMQTTYLSSIYTDFLTNILSKHNFRFSSPFYPSPTRIERRENSFSPSPRSLLLLFHFLYIIFFFRPPYALSKTSLLPFRTNSNTALFAKDTFYRLIYF